MEVTVTASARVGPGRTKCARLTGVSTWHMCANRILPTYLLAWHDRIEVGLATFAKRFNICAGSVGVEPDEVGESGEVAGIASPLFLCAFAAEHVRESDDSDRVPIAVGVDKAGRLVFGERLDDVLPLSEPVVAF